ncbi:methyl-accepting chemotaxis protein [Burkholderia sp. Ac-20379]|uniref:methyl-accepting chemotaxis protein n=1 Tax=Burkholderia sp. Ac-20379 TaxID=2703900 RepID=UPI0019804198|nr:methyl-accepting chemotaxis protein [Burkholderia sp. Ac-20379]MBN3725801.1 HAMP domain-containing protein [Burkholderia sp. Ac-20379]
MQNLSIGKKLSTAFCAVIAVFLVSSAVCCYGIAAIDHKQKQNAVSAQAQLVIKDATADYLNIIWSLLAYNLDGQPGHIKWKLDHIGDFAQHMAAIKTLDPQDTELNGLADKAQAQYDAWTTKVVNPMIEMRTHVNDGSATLAQLSALTEGFGSYLGTDDMIAAVDALDKAERQRIAMRTDELASLRHTINLSVLLAAALAVVCAVFAGRWLVTAIRDPLARAVTTAQAIAAGRLDSRIERDRTDETGRLLAAMHAMQASLQTIVGSVTSGVEAVKVGAAQIAAGNTDLSSRTEQQAAALEETSATTHELNEAVRQNAESARHACNVIERAMASANAGSAMSKQMIATMNEASGSAEKIASITSIIEGIAFQTNILALNAAVEAARAGAEGRGFAVVASEVRSLAQRSSTAAKEIKELIERSTASIGGGAARALDMGSTITQLQADIAVAKDVVEAISQASSEQSRGLEQVSQAIAQMDQVTQQNAALVEEAAAASHALDEQAVRLQGAVAVFSH